MATGQGSAVWWCQAVTGVRVEHHREAVSRAAARGSRAPGQATDAVCRSTRMSSPLPRTAPPGPLLPAGNPRIVGIVNITEASFSDGGRSLAPAAAVTHARKLLTDGADIIELGPAA